MANAAPDTVRRTRWSSFDGKRRSARIVESVQSSQLFQSRKKRLVHGVSVD
jgi:hypothetical protein